MVVKGEEEVYKDEAHKLLLEQTGRKAAVP
jgi:hypothetical protein